MTLVHCPDGATAREAEGSFDVEAPRTSARAPTESGVNATFDDLVAAVGAASTWGAALGFSSALMVRRGKGASPAMRSTEATCFAPVGTRATISIRLSFDACAAHTITPTSGTDAAPSNIPTRSALGCCAFNMRIRSENPWDCSTTRRLGRKCDGINPALAAGRARCSSYLARSPGSDSTSLALLIRLAALAGNPFTPISG